MLAEHRILAGQVPRSLREVFEARQKKWVSSLRDTFEKHGDGRSPQSTFASDIIYEICRRLKYPIPDKEKYMTDSVTDRHYAFDFTHGNKIIEFNGDYWRANPDKYKGTDFIKSKNMYADEIWQYDKLKLECAKRNGYEVLIIWESEWVENEEGVIKKCIDFLSD